METDRSSPARDLIARPLTQRVLGVFYDVYNELGFGFLESVYAHAMLIALRDAGVAVERERRVPVFFRGNQIGEYRADLLVADTVILELKTARSIDASHTAQLLHYLRATHFEVGLVLNFGLRPQFKRLVFTNEQKIRSHPR